MSLAILAIFSTLTFPVLLPYIFGSVSIMLAIISKGARHSFPRRSRTAVIVASVALAINTALIISSAFYFYRVLHDPALQEQFGKILYQTYGITFEDLLNQIGLQNIAPGNM
jgi:hypothetical protein